MLADGPLRVWVPRLLDGARRLPARRRPVRVYSRTAARSADFKLFWHGRRRSGPWRRRAPGVFLASEVARRLSPQRLEQFFIATAQGYQVTNAVPGACTFARQDLVEDPPFARLDLIDCRNPAVVSGQLTRKACFQVAFMHSSRAALVLVSQAELLDGFADFFTLAKHGCQLIAAKRKDGRAAAGFFQAGPGRHRRQGLGARDP